MGNLKRNYNRFMYKHRNKGIPNLMMWICLSNAVVFVLQNLFQVGNLASLLSFNASLIMQGQVWRLFSYIFTFATESGGLIFAILSILCYLWIGRALEAQWGTLRFNFFYLAGILLQSFYGMLFHWIFKSSVIFSSHYLNLSMFLAVATLNPDNKVLIYFLIPVKMKWIAWLDLGLTAYTVISNLYSITKLIGLNIGLFWIIGCVCAALFPLVALLNYFLFFGRDLVNILPDWMKRKKQRAPKRVVYTDPRPNPDWAKNYRSSSGEKPYRHKCTVCGRTDTSCPGLEFRYCSRCKGYFCYCIEHINNHNHIQ